MITFAAAFGCGCVAPSSEVAPDETTEVDGTESDRLGSRSDALGGGAFVMEDLYADVNGDGISDLIQRTYFNYIGAFLGPKHTSLYGEVLHGGPYLPDQARFADLNADGKADLIMRGADNAFWVSLSTGSGFRPPAKWVQHGGAYAPGQAQYADLNGDRRADLIMQGLDNSFWVSLSTGTGFRSPVRWLKHGGAFVQGAATYSDLNGDRRADLTFRGTDGRHWISYSTGSGFTAPRLR